MDARFFTPASKRSVSAWTILPAGFLGSADHEEDGPLPKRDALVAEGAALPKGVMIIYTRASISKVKKKFRGSFIL